MSQCHHCEAKPEIHVTNDGDLHCLSCLADHHRGRALLVLDYLVHFKRLSVPRRGRATEKRRLKREGGE